MSLVQQTALTNHQSVSSVSLTLNGVTAGNTLFAVSAYDDGNNTSSTPSSMSDSVGGAMGVDIQQLRTHNSATVYSLWNVAAGTHTVTSTAHSGASGNWTWALLEVSGIGLANSLDQTGAINGSGTSASVSCGALIQPIEFAIALCESGGAVTGYVTPSGWSNIGLLDSFPSVSFAYLLTNATTALSPNFGTLSAAGFVAVLATYKAFGSPVGAQQL